MPDPTPAAEDQAHERRVNQILDRARHEVGLRDFATLFGAKMWSMALAIAAAVYVAVMKLATTEKDRNDGA